MNKASSGCSIKIGSEMHNFITNSLAPEGCHGRSDICIEHECNIGTGHYVAIVIFGYVLIKPSPEATGPSIGGSAHSSTHNHSSVDMSDIIQYSCVYISPCSL